MALNQHLLHDPLEICLDLLPTTPLPPVQKRDAQHTSLQRKGAYTDSISPSLSPIRRILVAWPEQANGLGGKQKLKEMLSRPNMNAKSSFPVAVPLWKMEVTSRMLQRLSKSLAQVEKPVCSWSPKACQIQAKHVRLCCVLAGLQQLRQALHQPSQTSTFQIARPRPKVNAHLT